MEKIKSINGSKYFLALILLSITHSLLSNIFNLQDGSIYSYIFSIPFIIFVLYIAFFRTKNVYNKIGLTYYIFIYSVIHILFFGYAGFGNSLSIEQQFSLQDTNPLLYHGIMSGPVFALYNIIFNCLLIFKSARENG